MRNISVAYPDGPRPGARAGDRLTIYIPDLPETTEGTRKAIERAAGEIAAVLCAGATHAQLTDEYGRLIAAFQIAPCRRVCGQGARP